MMKSGGKEGEGRAEMALHKETWMMYHEANCSWQLPRNHTVTKTWLCEPSAAPSSHPAFPLWSSLAVSSPLHMWEFNLSRRGIMR